MVASDRGGNPLFPENGRSFPRTGIFFSSTVRWRYHAPYIFSKDPKGNGIRSGKLDENAILIRSWVYAGNFPPFSDAKSLPTPNFECASTDISLEIFSWQESICKNLWSLFIWEWKFPYEMSIFFYTKLWYVHIIYKKKFHI